MPYFLFILRDLLFIMLTIRFSRVGKRNKAYFRIVLQEHTIAPGGRHIEVLGSWDPHMKKAVLKADNIKYWVSKGAQISDSAYNLFIKEGILEGKKRAVKMPKKEEEAKPEAPVSEVKPAEDKKEENKPKEPKEEKKAEDLKPAETDTKEVDKK